MSAGGPGGPGGHTFPQQQEMSPGDVILQQLLNLQAQSEQQQQQMHQQQPQQQQQQQQLYPQQQQQQHFLQPFQQQQFQVPPAPLKRSWSDVDVQQQQQQPFWPPPPQDQQFFPQQFGSPQMSSPQLTSPQLQFVNNNKKPRYDQPPPPPGMPMGFPPMMTSPQPQHLPTPPQRQQYAYPYPVPQAFPPQQQQQNAFPTPGLPLQQQFLPPPPPPAASPSPVLQYQHPVAFPPPQAPAPRPVKPKAPKAPKPVAPAPSRPMAAPPPSRPTAAPTSSKAPPLPKAPAPQRPAPVPAPSASPSPTLAKATSSAPAVLTRPGPAREEIPTVPLLYHLAVSAHQAAHHHLRQAFVPSSIRVPGGEDPTCPPIRMTRVGRGPKSGVPFTHDANAATTSLRLLVLSADLLRSGLSTAGLSDKEKVAFGLEFVTVGIKILAAVEEIGRLDAAQRAKIKINVDTENLATDVEDTITKSHALSLRSPALKTYRHGLELSNARLAFMRDKVHHGKRVIKQALAMTTKDEFQHRYSLRLMLMAHLEETSHPDFFAVADEIESEARSRQHFELMQLIHVARIKAYFSQRKWDKLQPALDECAKVMRLTQPPPEPVAGGSNAVASGSRPKSPQSLAWKASLTAHFLLLRALYQGRIGEDNKVKLVLKSLYNLIDDSTDQGYLDAMRNSGGIVEFILPSPSGPPQSLFVQSTPINVLYTLTYITTIVSRREFLGSSATCRTLVHSRAMREWEDVARAEDFWDSGFSQVHGLAEALRLRKVMATLKAEGMMEEALAHIIRSSFAEADKVLTDTVRHLRRCHLFNSHLPQLSLLYAQFTHILGLSDNAVRYYRAAQSMITPGSELRLVVDVGLLSASGGLEGLRDSHERSQYVNMLADACRTGNNAMLSAVGSFLSSLTETERVISKRFLSNAYELARKGNMNVLHCLIFAFTTGAHVYGDSERQLKQLESGRSITQMLGGLDRPDGVGQTILGLWYAVKLRDAYRLAGRLEDEKASQVSVDKHFARIAEVREFASRRFPSIPPRPQIQNL